MHDVRRVPHASYMYVDVRPRAMHTPPMLRIRMHGRDAAVSLTSYMHIQYIYACMGGMLL